MESKQSLSANKKQRNIALLSVFNKEGIIELAQILQKKYEVVSTGGTAKLLTEHGMKVTPIEKITSFSESFDGRLKTIHPKIEGGILFDRENTKHLIQAKNLGIKPIDIVVCNLYPFEETPAIENIDIGGVTLIRAAAKNYKQVLVVTDPNDYSLVCDAVSKNKINKKLQKYLAEKAFEETSFYDCLISQYFRDQTKNNFPDKFTIAGRKKFKLRYGENQHQEGFFYSIPFKSSTLPNLIKHGGRDLSFINVTDINAGVEVVRLFKEPAAVVIKHNSPCGIALGGSSEEALERAIAADPESAFGGVVILNKPFNLKCAKIIANFKSERRGNMDIVAATKFETEGLDFLLTIRKSMGIYSFGDIPKKPSGMHVKTVDGGFILQTADNYIEKGFKDWEIVTKKKPSEKELKQMKLAWKFISRIRSNAIIVMDPNLPMTRGIGSGQTSRVRSVKIALDQAGRFAKGAVLASDSFFPFGDSVELATKTGIAAILQEGGSINDKLSIEAANKAGTPMVLTHHRAFWH